MKKRILILLGHSSKNSFCGTLAETYVNAAQAAGHEVKFIALGELTFDPILRAGYQTPQTLEPELVDAQAAITWAEHLVFVYPIWWGGLPALLKGFIDRVFLPNFAFKYRQNSMMWDRLLTGRSARIISTMDTPPWYFRWIYRMPGHNQIKRTILEFSGIKPVTISSFGSVKTSTPEQRSKWLAEVTRLGQNAG
jgi:putative NADPH-quinone reductase